MPERQPPLPAFSHWSDGETSVLIEAWGPLHLRRPGGRLLLQDWRTAARAVNAHRAAAREVSARRAVSAGRCSARTIAHCRMRVYFLKQLYKKELSKQPPSQWLFFSRLHAFLTRPTGPPPGFPPKMASVKEEEEEVGGALVGRWKLPTRPRTGAAGWGCSPAAAVVAKLAEVYERVEMERLDVERGKMEIEMQKLEQATKKK